MPSSNAANSAAASLRTVERSAVANPTANPSSSPAKMGRLRSQTLQKILRNLPQKHARQKQVRGRPRLDVRESLACLHICLPPGVHARRTRMHASSRSSRNEQQHALNRLQRRRTDERGMQTRRQHKKPQREPAPQARTPHRPPARRAPTPHLSFASPSPPEQEPPKTGRPTRQPPRAPRTACSTGHSQAARTPKPRRRPSPAWSSKTPQARRPR